MVVKFVVWNGIPCGLVLCATIIVNLIAPQAVGSGIPEMKTILGGVVLKEYLSFRAVVAKIIGLTMALSTGLPLGKVGPFVHMANILARQLSRLGAYMKRQQPPQHHNNIKLQYETLAAASAVGVACAYAAPIGGVMFSIEVTSVYFAINSYWRGFYAAVCGALFFRLLPVLFERDMPTVTAIFRTTFRAHIPFEPLELVAFGVLGVCCGLLGATYVALHRRIVFIQRRIAPKYAQYCSSSRCKFMPRFIFVHAVVVTLAYSTVMFPPWLGQYVGGRLSLRSAVSVYFYNTTWLDMAAAAENQPVNAAALTPYTSKTTSNKTTSNSVVRTLVMNNFLNSPFPRGTTTYRRIESMFLILSLYFVTHFVGTAIVINLPVPAGTFMPLFVLGAAFGRLFGELMALCFPRGVGVHIHSSQPVIPGVYAVVGAAALSGAATHTLSTCVIAAELTGQIVHIMPVMVGVMVANFVAKRLQPSIYDSIIRLKRLPYLPHLDSCPQTFQHTRVESVMQRNVTFLTLNASYRDVQTALRVSPTLHHFPLVDCAERMVLIGVILRAELETNVDNFLNTNDEPDKLFLLESQRQIHQPTPLADTSIGGTVVGVGEQHNSFCSSSLQFGVDCEKNSATSVDRIDTNRLTMRFFDSIITGSIDKTKTKTIEHYVFEAGADKYARRQASEMKICDRVVVTMDPQLDANQRQLESRCYRGRAVEPSQVILSTRLSRDKVTTPHTAQQPFDFAACHVKAPLQVVQYTSLSKLHRLFSLLGVQRVYATSLGRLVGVISVGDLRRALESHQQRHNTTTTVTGKHHDLPPRLRALELNVGGDNNIFSCSCWCSSSESTGE